MAARQVAPAPAATAALGTAAEHQALVDKFCVTCHNARTSTPAADPLRLDGVDLTNVAKDARTWERVLLKLSVGAMPPQGMPHPEPAALTTFRAYVANGLDRAAAQANNPGQFVVHRLNRVEYANAIRDLLAVDFNATDMLPSDGGDFGFDNIAAALKTSPLLLERYLAAALKISNEAVGNRDATPSGASFPISLEHSQNEHLEGLPLGTRGGTLVRYNFPADAEYQLSGRLQWAVIEGLIGIEGAEKPREFVITIDGEQVYSAPIGGEQDHTVNSADITRTRPVIDGRMTARVFVTAGLHEVGFTWIDQPGQEQAAWEPPRRDSQEVHFVGGWPKLRVVNIDGPYNVKGISNTPSRQKLFVCKPTGASDETACAERIVATLAKRAYRRPVTASDTAAPLSFYADARKSGGDFDAGIRAAVARVLASPSFLYRVERDPETLPAGAAHKVTDLELASRLSFFLWNSIPDDQLLNLAIAGQLRAPGVLAAQVKRMVADERADSFVQAFTGQWLTLRNLESKVGAGPAALPALRRQHPQGLPDGNRDVVCECAAGQREHHDADQRELQLPERAPGEALRDQGRVWGAVPEGGDDGSEPAGAAGAGEPAGGDVGGDADVADDSREVHPDGADGAAGAGAAAVGAAARSERAADGGTAADDAGARGVASAEPGVRVVPPDD